MSSFSFFEDYIKSVFQEFIDFQLGTILLTKNLSEKIKSNLIFSEVFQFTPEVRECLEKEKFPDLILGKLEKLKKDTYNSLPEYKENLVNCLGEDAFRHYGNTIIEASKTRSSKIVKSRRILFFNLEYVISTKLNDYLNSPICKELTKQQRNNFDELIKINKKFSSAYEFLEFINNEEYLSSHEFRRHRETLLELCFVSNLKDESRFIKHTDELQKLNASFPTDAFAYYGIIKFIENLERMKNRGLSSIIPEILQEVFFYEHPLLKKGEPKENFWDILELRHKIAHGAIIENEKLNLNIVSSYNNILRTLAKDIDSYLINNFFINEYYRYPKYRITLR